MPSLLKTNQETIPQDQGQKVNDSIQNLPSPVHQGNSLVCLIMNYHQVVHQRAITGRVYLNIVPSLRLVIPGWLWKQLNLLKHWYSLDQLIWRMNYSVLFFCRQYFALIYVEVQVNTTMQVLLLTPSPLRHYLVAIEIVHKQFDPLVLV